MLKDCREVPVNEGDFVIYVVQGNRNAGIEFGYILEIKDKSETHMRSTGLYTHENYAVKIQHASADGTRKNTLVEETPGYWINGVTNWDRYQEDYVKPVMKDSGKPSTTRLNCGGTEHRLLVTKPYI